MLRKVMEVKRLPKNLKSERRERPPSSSQRMIKLEVLLLKLKVVPAMRGLQRHIPVSFWRVELEKLKKRWQRNFRVEKSYGVPIKKNFIEKDSLI